MHRDRKLSPIVESARITRANAMDSRLRKHTTDTLGAAKASSFFDRRKSYPHFHGDTATYQQANDRDHTLKAKPNQLEMSLEIYIDKPSHQDESSVLPSLTWHSVLPIDFFSPIFDEVPF